jgi:hypothetical protein
MSDDEKVYESAIIVAVGLDVAKSSLDHEIIRETIRDLQAHVDNGKSQARAVCFHIAEGVHSGFHPDMTYERLLELTIEHFQHSLRHLRWQKAVDELCVDRHKWTRKPSTLTSLMRVRVWNEERGIGGCSEGDLQYLSESPTGWALQNSPDEPCKNWFWISPNAVVDIQEQDGSWQPLCG